jgi:hypothetical protein
MPLLVLVTEGISGPSELEEGIQRREVITWDEVWNLSDSPVIVDEGINVDSGGSLTIESGVVVNIIGTSTGISVWSGSSIHIEGTSDQPVTVNVGLEDPGIKVGGGTLGEGFAEMNASYVIFNQTEWNFGRADLDSYNTAYKRIGQSLRPQYDSYQPKDADFAAIAVRTLKEDLNL